MTYNGTEASKNAIRAEMEKNGWYYGWFAQKPAFEFQDEPDYHGTKPFAIRYNPSHAAYNVTVHTGNNVSCKPYKSSTVQELSVS